MNARAFRIGCLLAFLLALSAGCNLSERQQRIDFTDVEAPPPLASVNADAQALRVAIASVLLPQETAVHYRALANFLGQRVGRPVILIQRNSYAEIALLLLNGGADIAFFSSGGYANYSGFDEIEILATQQRMGVPYYQGYIVVAKDSEIDDIAGLRGRTVAFTDPLSYSGHTFFVELLRQIGQTPETFFSRYLYTYSHDNSFRAVANRVVDAASVSRVVYDRAKERQPELADAVKIIAVSPPAGIGPVVAGKSVGKRQRKLLRQALVAMHEVPAMLPALRGLSIDRFVPPDPALFEPIRRMLREERDAL